VARSSWKGWSTAEEKLKWQPVNEGKKPENDRKGEEPPARESQPKGAYQRGSLQVFRLSEMGKRLGFGNLGVSSLREGWWT